MYEAAKLGLPSTDVIRDVAKFILDALQLDVRTRTVELGDDNELCLHIVKSHTNDHIHSRHIVKVVNDQVYAMSVVWLLILRSETGDV